MNKEFIPYEEALALKELGFDEPCLGFYDDQLNKDNSFYLNDSFNKNGRFIYTSTPLYQQAFRWFREKHNLNGEITYLPNVEKYGIITSDMTGMKPKNLSKNENFERGKKITNNFVKYETYEEAEIECLKELIKIVKNK